MLRDRILRLPNLTILPMPFFNVLAKSGILCYEQFKSCFFFLLFFLKICFHAVLNKSKNIVFRVSPGPPPTPPLALYVPLIDFRLPSLAISPRSGSCLFALFWRTVFVNILQLSFSIYIFSHLNMVVRQTLVSVYIQRNPALRSSRLYDNLLSHLPIP